MFLTCMIWLILDDRRQPIVIKEGRFVYAVVDVIDARFSVTVEESSDSSESEINTELVSPSFRISELMFATFLDRNY